MVTFGLKKAVPLLSSGAFYTCGKYFPHLKLGPKIQFSHIDLMLVILIWPHPNPGIIGRPNVLTYPKSWREHIT